MVWTEHWRNQKRKEKTNMWWSRFVFFFFFGSKRVRNCDQLLPSKRSVVTSSIISLLISEIVIRCPELELPTVGLGLFDSMENCQALKSCNRRQSFSNFCDFPP